MHKRPRELAAEDGFTLIELMIASLIMVVGLLALVSGLDHSRDLVTQSEKVEAATHQAEKAVERILAMRYDEVSVTTAPSDSDSQADPRYWVSGSTYQWDQNSTGSAAFETLCVTRCPAEEATVAGTIVGAEEWKDPDTRLQGWIHRFVTEVPDLCTAAACPGAQPAKRVTVGVTVDGAKPLSKPVLISTLMIDPADSGN
jgi:prepilin-type N-terminal cleavage/methylation domain-containing protein